MFEDLGRHTALQLDELAIDLPSNIRAVARLTAARESGAAAAFEADRALEDAVRPLAGECRRFEKEELHAGSPLERLQLAQHVMECLSRQLEAIESGSRVKSTEALLREIFAGPGGDAAPTALSRPQLEQAAGEACARLTEIHGRTHAAELSAFSCGPDRRAEFLRELGFRPGGADASFDAGCACAERGAYGEAVKHFRRACDLDPQDSFYRSYLALSLCDAGRPAEAAEQALRAIKVNPDEQMAWTVLGRAHERLGEDQKAADAYLKAVSLDTVGGGPCAAQAGLQRLSLNREVEMPRPDGFRPPDTDTIFSYKVHGAQDSQCRIRIFEGSGRTIVLATWGEKSTGPAIEGCPENVAAQVSRRFGIDPAEMLYVEHFEEPPIPGRDLCMVTFGAHDRGHFSDPQWIPLSFGQFETLCGWRLRWTGK